MGARAVCYALSSLADSPDVLLTPDDAARDAVEAIRVRWLARAAELGSDASPDLGRRLAAAAHCPPIAGIGWRVPEAGMPCMLRALCPFCWARYRAVRMYERVERAVYDRGESKPAWNTLTVVTEWTWPVGKVEPRVLFAAISRGSAAGSVGLRSYYVWRHLKQAYAAAALTTVEPTVSEKEKTPSWLLSHRVLALVDSRQAAPPVDDGALAGCVLTSRVLLKPGCSRATLAGAVGRFALYPRGLLFGSAEMVRRILEERGRHDDRRVTQRLSSPYGA